jgi:hypothetical protein
MRDGVAVFYDPYSSPYALRSRRWGRRNSDSPLHLSKGAVLIGLAGILLLGLLVADASALYATPVKVTVTEIQWFVGNYSVGNQSGFTIAGGHTFSESLTCQLFCPTFKSARVNAPFTLVSDTFAYPWYEYANLTIQAPNSDYSGPLDITFPI